MRMTASWSGSQTDLPHTSVRREEMRPNGELPSDDHADINRRHQTLKLRRKARLPVHRPSACSGLKALRNTSDARRQAAKLRYRFGPLTPSARSGNLTAGDGTKNGLPAPNKELTANPKQPLDRKSPIQVSCEPYFLSRDLGETVDALCGAAEQLGLLVGRIAGRQAFERCSRGPECQISVVVGQRH